MSNGQHNRYERSDLPLNDAPRIWSERPGSNRCPVHGAHGFWPLNYAREMVDLEGLEPPAPCLQSRNSASELQARIVRWKMEKRRSLQPGFHRSRARGFRRTCRVGAPTEAAPKANDKNKKPSAGYSREGSTILRS